MGASTSLNVWRNIISRAGLCGGGRLSHAYCDTCKHSTLIVDFIPFPDPDHPARYQLLCGHNVNVGGFE